MKIYNTFSDRIEDFKPQSENAVLMYSCGPTVYDNAHIGNLRSYIFNDLLRRTLEFEKYKAKQVMNITDVDDKTIRGSGGDKAKFTDLIKKYEEAFFADIAALNIEKPEIITHATGYIEQMVDFISDLLDKGFAYKGEDGSIYFSINKFSDYGRLSKLNKEGIRAGARVSQDEYSKENPADFALWKAWDENDGEIFWETRFGKGRPGWHIECSTMANLELGETIDIHTGGVDNIFPHHENEIAQSEARNGTKFVNFWIHGEHLLVDGRKMAKSEGNFYKLADLVDKGYSPLDFRYFAVGAHYRSKLNFTFEGMESARNSRVRLLRIIAEIGQNYTEKSPNSQYLEQFKAKIDNDLDTPGALAVLWNMIRDDKVENGEKYAAILEMDKVLGLKLGQKEDITIPDEVNELVQKREEARKSGNYAESDQIRTQILDLGWKVEDTASGQKIERI
ncbi:MAG: cysteine--tRNA ligase [Patescibacteria group bacterium]